MSLELLPIFVTARMGSARLPEKHLLPMFETKPSIECLIERLSHTDLPIFLCTGDRQEDLPLHDIANKAEIGVFAGDPENVLRRYLQAMESLNVSAAIIVDGDDLFVSTSVIKQISQIFDNHDLIDCVGFPYGGVPFLLSKLFLEKLLEKNITPNGWSRFLDKIPGKKHTIKTTKFKEFGSDLRLSLDYTEDLLFIRHLFSEVQSDEPIMLENVVEYTRDNIDLLKAKFPGLFDGTVAAQAKSHLS